MDLARSQRVFGLLLPLYLSDLSYISSEYFYFLDISPLFFGP